MNRKSNPIFIIGTPRSGTTLTAKILGKHSHLFMPGETHFIDDIYSRRKEIGNLYVRKNLEVAISRLATLYRRFNEPVDQARIDILFSKQYVKERMLETTSGYSELLTAFMEIQMEYEKKQRWGNNTPKDIFNVNEIFEFYPQAKLIVCVRDVRDFLLSYKGKWKATSKENISRIKNLYHPILTSLLWKSSMKKVGVLKRTLPKNRIFIIKYEELVTNVEYTVRSICDYIEEDFESDMLNIDFSNSSNNGNGNGNKKIYSTSIGKWEKKLPVDEARLSQILVKNELLNLDYRIEPLKCNWVKMAIHFLSLPSSVLKALKVNKNFRGPIFPYLWKRLSILLNKN